MHLQIKMENITCYTKLINSVDVKKNLLVFNNQILHMRTVIRAIDGFASSLTALGFEKGDVLTVFLPTTPQAVVAFYACSKIGVIANFVHPLVPIEQLKHNLEMTHSKGLMYYSVLIKNGKVLADMGQILIKCSIGDFYFLRKPFHNGYASLENKDTPVKIAFSSLAMTKLSADNGVKASGEDIVCTMHSGGTSGEPKIVKLSNNALNGVAESLDSFANVNTGKEYSLAALPVFHAYGLGVSIHTAIVKRYNVVLMSKFNAKRANRFLKRYPITMFAGVPVMFKKMAECNNFAGRHLKKLRLLWCGGDAVSASLMDKINYTLRNYGSVARLMPGYGLTEVCGVCTANTDEFYNKKSCGRPIPGTTIEIWDKSENSLPANSVGEIVINSPSIMSGYLSGDSGIVQKDGKLWIKTGDIGYLDGNGFLFFVDRKKRSIKINAISIFPSEIETLVRTLDFVDDVCAIPYQKGNKTLFKLCVTLCGENNNEDKLRQEIMALCEQQLIKYAVPHEICFIKTMPRTKMGKIDYNRIELM